MTIIRDLERAKISRSLAASDLRRVRGRWLMEAVRHERAAEDKFERREAPEKPNDRETRMLHLEIARVLRNCARDLGA